MDQRKKRLPVRTAQADPAFERRLRRLDRRLRVYREEDGGYAILHRDVAGRVYALLRHIPELNDDVLVQLWEACPWRQNLAFRSYLAELDRHNEQLERVEIDDSLHMEAWERFRWIQTTKGQLWLDKWRQKQRQEALGC